MAGLLGASTAWAAGSASYFSALPASGSTELAASSFLASAVSLPNGEVLIAGGQNDGGSAVQNAALFNPASGTFTALPASGNTELQTAREGAVAASLPNGQVLIAGGYGNGGPLQSAEMFSPATATFTALPASGNTELQTAGLGAVAAALPNGQVLIAGGSDGSVVFQSAELFDPVAGSFTALPASGNTELQTARFGAVAVSLPNGKVLIAGGQATSNGNALQSAELFDPATGSFTALPASGNTELQAARAGAVATSLPNGEVLIAGGKNSSGTSLQSAELFNPATETFTALPASGNTELQTARYAAAAAPLPNGQVLIAGGAVSGSHLQSAEVYVSAPQAAVAGGTFGTQTVSEPAPESVITVTNLGAQTLAIARASLGGADPTDFLIAQDGCSGRSLTFAQSCTITAGFTPDSTGTKTATISLSDNEAAASTINLAGTGVAPNAGPTGATGATGASGTAGAAGANGMVDLISCKSVVTGKRKHRKTVQRCTSRLTSSPIKITTTARSVTAVLSRNGIVYATGQAIRSGSHIRMLLIPVDRIHDGTYTLRLIHDHRTRTNTITIT
ncbi:MAG: kelch repeat-containing protein [Solirubrobacteraceae bacterium]